MITVTCGGAGLRLAVRREISSLIPGLVDELEAARGRPFRPDWCGGFACRPIADTETPSNHSWGLAIDLDPPENPQLRAAMHKEPHPLRRTFPGGIVVRSTMPDNVQAIAEGRGFNWGGVYKNKPDPMHFEFLGTHADATGHRGRISAPEVPAMAPRRGRAGVTAPGTYVVKAGDTLSEIGQFLGVPWRKLASDNGIPPPYWIRPGQVLHF